MMHKIRPPTCVPQSTRAPDPHAPLAPGARPTPPPRPPVSAPPHNLNPCPPPSRAAPRTAPAAPRPPQADHARAAEDDAYAAGGEWHAVASHGLAGISTIERYGKNWSPDEGACVSRARARAARAPR